MPGDSGPDARVRNHNAKGGTDQSGIIGAFLAETAERRKSSIELSHAMADTEGINESDDDENHITLKEEDYYPNIELKEDFAEINGEIIEKERT